MIGKIFAWMLRKALVIDLIFLKDGMREYQKKHYSGDAGIDMRIVDAVEIQPHAMMQCPTGIELKCEHNLPVFFCVYPRSSTGMMGVHVVQSVYDSGYKGEIILSIHNANNTPIKLKKGARIAQIVPLPYFKIAHGEVGVERGKRGYGSTGK